MLAAILGLGMREARVGGIRLAYFILEVPAATEAAPFSSSDEFRVWKQGRVIGHFEVAGRAGSMLLCRLVSGDPGSLDGSCTARLPEPLRMVAATSSPSPAAAQAAVRDSLQVAGHDFRRLGQVYLSRERFAYSEFGALDKLNSFLSRLEAESGSYRFSIPSDSFIRQNESDFRKLQQDGFFICLVEGRLGYCQAAPGVGMRFKSVSPDTLAAMAAKFHFLLVAQKK